MSFHYLATPYSKYEGGIEQAAKMAAGVTGMLMRWGVPAFSPIVHSHLIATVSEIDPLDWKFWLEAAEPMMRASCGLLIYKTRGWRRSFGIAQEVKAFRAMKKPVRAITPQSINDPGVHAVLRYATAATPKWFTLQDACAADGRKLEDVLAARQAEVARYSPVAQSVRAQSAGQTGTVEVAGSSPAGAASFSREEIEAAAAQAICTECGQPRSRCECIPAFLRRQPENNNEASPK